MSQDRDPRTDPRAGDLLRKPGRMRQTEWRQRLVIDPFAAGSNSELVTFHELTDRLGVVGRKTITRSAWRRWAKGAEVLMRGEE